LLRNIKGIIFDFDGTLFDNSLIPFYLIAQYPPDFLRIWRERLTRKRFTGRDYSTPEKYYRTFFLAFGKVCRRSPHKVRHWYFNHYMPRMVRVLKRHYKPRPGVIELFGLFDAIAKARAKAPPPKSSYPHDFNAGAVKIAVYSDYPFLKERMEVLGILPNPEIKLYGPDSFGAQKPTARPFKAIAADFSVTPEECLVVGDREETDGIGAFKAGMRFFCLETGRKRYFRLDPYRCPEMKDGKSHGPSLIMYAGNWAELVKLLCEKFRQYTKGE